MSNQSYVTTSRITAKTRICLTIGDPVEHSLSPTMHNAAYRELGIDDKFVFVAARVKVEHLADFVQAVRVMNILGVSCTLPHKLEVIKYLDWVDPIAEDIGAVNTVVNEGGVLKGYNTDWLGVVAPLEKLTSLERRKVAVIGAGGAARAAVYGLVNRGAIVKVYNRTVAKAESLAREFRCWAGGLEELGEIVDAEIIINTTSVGLSGTKDESLVNPDFIKSHHICFDAVYTPYETKFLRDAKAVGATIIHGTEMLIHQGMVQFKHFTNQNAPEEVMRQAVLQALGVSE